MSFPGSCFLLSEDGRGTQKCWGWSNPKATTDRSRHLSPGSKATSFLLCGESHEFRITKPSFLCLQLFCLLAIFHLPSNEELLPHQVLNVVEVLQATEIIPEATYCLETVFLLETNRKLWKSIKLELVSPTCSSP